MYERGTGSYQSLLLNQQTEDTKPKGVINTLKHQWASPEDRKFLIIKIIIALLGIGVLAFNSAYNLINHAGSVDCFTDVAQNWVLPITMYLKDHDFARHAVILCSSLCIDINIVLTGLRWIFYGKSLRVFFVLFVFYIARGLVQRTFAMKFPAEYIFDSPGFFSVAVPYWKTNDFFFSGHVGISTLFFLEYKKDGSWLKYFGFFAVIYNTFALLVTEGHYSIDLAVGIMTAHYVYSLGLWMDQSLDNTKNGCLALFSSNRQFPKGDQDHCVISYKEEEPHSSGSL